MSSSISQPSTGSELHRCCSCKSDHPVADFAPGELRRPSSRCRECVRAKNRAAYESNIEERRAGNRRYYEENKAHLLPRNRARYAERSVEYRERRLQWWAENKDRINAGRRQFRSADTYKSWVSRLAKHGLTPDAYHALLDEQGGVCAICGTANPGRAGGGGERVFVVDHCHETGRVRGLLCHHCNRGLGYFRDDPDALRRAAAYIQ